MVRRFLSSMLITATAFAMSSAANPNAPSPVKEEPPAAFERGVPNQTLADDFDGRRQAGATDALA